MNTNFWNEISELLPNLTLEKIGSVVALLGAISVIVVRSVTMLRDLDSARPLGMRKKVPAYKYFELINDVEGLGDENARSVISLKDALFSDVKVDMIYMYLNEKYRQKMDRWQSEVIVFIVGFFVISILNFVLGALASKSVKENDFSDVKTAFAIMVIACVVAYMLVLLGYVIAVVLRGVRIISAFICLKIRKMYRMSLNSIVTTLNYGQEYLFIDATVRSSVPLSLSIGDSNNVLMLERIDEREYENFSWCGLLKIWFGFSDKKVARLVKNFLQPYESSHQDLVCFVYSRYGLSAVQVTKALQNCGISAHYIGKLDGRTKELSRTIKEVELLRACGLK